MCYSALPRRLRRFTSASTPAKHITSKSSGFWCLPPVAERAVQLSLAHGPVAQMYCMRAVSSVLTQLPGFEILKSRLFSNRLADDFQAILGVVRTIIRENDADDKSIAQAAIDATLTAPR